MKIKEIPILLLTGYLGSGKTTLVNHILSNKRGVKFAVIVNDIGEINVDQKLIDKNAQIQGYKFIIKLYTIKSSQRRQVWPVDC